MNEWMNIRTNKWTHESINKWMNKWTNEWMDKRMNERINEWMNEWMNERINEWMNEWMNEYKIIRRVNEKKTNECMINTISVFVNWISVNNYFRGIKNV